MDMLNPEENNGPGSPVVSVVLGSYNRLPWLQMTIESVRAEMNDLSHEIVVVDGGSDDGCLEWLLGQKDILTIVQHNHGTWDGKPVRRQPWGYFMNLGFRCAKGVYVCMLSDDCLVVPGSIRNGITLFDAERNSGQRVGAVAFYWRNWPEERTYRVGLTLGNRMFVNHGLYLRHALDDVDYIDETTYSFYHADGDLCLKMWASGYTCIDSPDSYIEHYSHANSRVRRANLARQKQDWKAYLARWEGTFYDPHKKLTGGWIEKEFDDPFRTGDQYRTAAKGTAVLRLKATLRRSPLAARILSAVRNAMRAE
jgi:glycosyltransferase involved in cell wall biosynthesis